MEILRNQPAATMEEWNTRHRKIVKGSKADGFNERKDALFCLDKTEISFRGCVPAEDETYNNINSDSYQRAVDKRATDYYDWVAKL